MAVEGTSLGLAAWQAISWARLPDCQSCPAAVWAEPPRGTRAACPWAFASLAHRVRQLIEVVNAQLEGQFRIERTLAKTLWGLLARVQAKLTAHTLGVYLNVLSGRPPLALKTLVV